MNRRFRAGLGFDRFGFLVAVLYIFWWLLWLKWWLTV